MDPLKPISTSISSELDISQTFLFLELCWQLVPHIELLRHDPATGASHGLAPYELPDMVIKFLADCLFSKHDSHEIAAINQAWKCLSRTVWENRNVPREAAHLLEYFFKYGQKHNIGMSSTLTAFSSHLSIGFTCIGPPTRWCPDPQCTDRRGGIPYTLAERTTHSAILFTKKYGPIPVFTCSLKCRG